MEIKKIEDFDIAVIGAGHAGCEAGLAAARLGMKTVVFSINLEAVANMFCNPAIGGTGKGHLVREIDALGGEMGLVIDKTFIQSHMLNMSKGPAVHSLRAQADKLRYHEEMKHVLELQENLCLKQGEAADIDFDEEGRARGVILRTGAYYGAKAVIIATGTFLGGKIFTGDCVVEGGPGGLSPSNELAINLRKRGMKFRRFKTGTPARVLSSSINYSGLAVQKGDGEIIPFSFMNDKIEKEQVNCYLTYTNPKTHEIIRRNFARSALYGGLIEGIGPRYCPSIESKVKRFPERERHQCFIEPEGLYTEEMYLQGMATSLPEDTQIEFYRTMAGLENAEIVRSAYAIEYDCIDPLMLKPSLEHKGYKGLFCAGQFNGSSGYEEAAAQGIMAGINAVRFLRGEKPFILDRSEAYIGVLIDDLVTKGTNEPYRMMTSRAEYRLLLRQDNADLRLTEKGRKIGLVSDERYVRFLKTKAAFEEELFRLENTHIPGSAAEKFLKNLNGSSAGEGMSLADLLKRPEVGYDVLGEIDEKRPRLPLHVREKIEVNIKYEGYVEKQKKQVEHFKKLEEKLLPKNIEYGDIHGISIEARQKLDAIRPSSVGQASRISGVSPADINVLLILLEKMKRGG